MQKPVAMWNTARGVWEKPETIGLLCEHLELFLETWPTSGSMRNGMAFERPMPEHHTTGFESSFLPTVMAVTYDRTPEQVAKRLETRKEYWQLLDEKVISLLRTPTAAEVEGGALSPEVAKAKGQTLKLTGQVLAMLPTVTVSDTFTDQMKSSQQKAGSMHSVNLSQAVHMDWGKFEQPVKRWEEQTNRIAPAPTLPDGQKGQHRLSALFTEWMMGLQAGWITGRGLHRKDEIKMAGNGVVPQQAKLALEILIKRYDISGGGD